MDNALHAREADCLCNVGKKPGHGALCFLDSAAGPDPCPVACGYLTLCSKGWGPFNWQRLDEPAELEAHRRGHRGDLAQLANLVQHRSITNELADKYNTTPLRILVQTDNVAGIVGSLKTAH